MQLHDSGLTQASLYDNAASRRFLIELRNVIVLHNFPIKADTAAVSPSRPPRCWYSALSFSRQGPIRSETFLRCCALICFLNLTEPITARTWCIYSQPSSDNVPVFVFFPLLQILKRSCTEILSVEPSSVCVNGEWIRSWSSAGIPLFTARWTTELASSFWEEFERFIRFKQCWGSKPA